ncbi:hypothetical protein [Paraburkholderia sp. BCC1884]|uniref:hypothetical protein n=1 Tax=Paraburkholderia sp. BCC1884 TaxID=2562668 RepID=UPI001642F726|nr:hypothetical protein [Paraburkholderia sp. BCC1884]
MGTSQLGHTILKVLTGLALLCATAAILNNVLSYRMVLQEREKAADGVAASLAALGERNGNADAILRRNFYAVLEMLGKDPSLHHGDTGVFVADSAFFDGAYIDKSPDAVLERCAVQPFTIPALTGMPLIAALRDRHNNCKYDSYAYQYLPAHEAIAPAGSAQPCTLARLRGLRKVVVIHRVDTTFTAARLNCENG